MSLAGRTALRSEAVAEGVPGDRSGSLGETNQVIANELFLFRRTVESHISRTLRKLGCGSRKEPAPVLLDIDA